MPQAPLSTIISNNLLYQVYRKLEEAPARIKTNFCVTWITDIFWSAFQMNLTQIILALTALTHIVHILSQLIPLHESRSFFMAENLALSPTFYISRDTIP